MPSAIQQAWAVVQPTMAAVGAIALSASTITAVAYWIEMFLKEATLPEFHKEEIRAAPMSKRTNLFLKAVRSWELAEAQRANIAFYNYVMANGIFLTEAFNAAFKEIHALIHAACAEQQSNFDLEAFPGSKPDNAAKALNEDGKKKLDALQSEIVKRLGIHRKN